jgi:hypothetical protein
MKVPAFDPREIVVTNRVPEAPQSKPPAPLLIFPFLAPPQPATSQIPPPSSALLVHSVEGGQVLVRGGRVHFAAR